MPDAGKMTLRRTTTAELDYIVELEKHQENRSYVFQQTREEHQDMLSQKDMLHLTVWQAAKPAGYVIIRGLLHPARSLELRRFVIEHKGRGAGRLVLRLCKAIAFEELGAHRLWLDVVDYNHRAIELYRSEGFVQEGVLRECDLFEGKYASLVVMSMLSREYDEWRMQV